MTASGTNPPPDFFEEHSLDPVMTAKGRSGEAEKADASQVPKKKAGFYLSKALLARFDRQFHQLKIDGVPVDNKSALLELVLEYALADLERTDESVLRRRLHQGR